jgi:hypothetical protein
LYSSARRDGPLIKSSFSTGSILARKATSPGSASAGIAFVSDFPELTPMSFIKLNELTYNSQSVS